MSGRENVWTAVSGEVFTEADAARLAEEFERDDAALDTANVTFPRRAVSHQERRDENATFWP